MNQSVERFVPLVDFLAAALGSNTEVVLHDFTDLDHSVVKIVNNHVSGRELGAPATDFALKILRHAEKEGAAYIADYVSHSTDRRPLRSASYLIRENGNVVGMMCLNTDVEPLEEMCELARHVLAAYAPPTSNGDDGPEGAERSTVERLAGNTHDLIARVIADSPICRDKDVTALAPQERTELIRELEDSGVFLLKGAVADVAHALEISEPSVYRYLQKVRKG